MPVFTSSIEVTSDYPTIKPSLNLNFARSRSLDPRITFTRASDGTYVGRDGLIKTAGEDEARFDHDPDTLESLGLLIEEQRTNEVSNSGSPTSGANLTPSFLTVSSVSDVVAPDGTTNGVARYTTNGSGAGALRFGSTSGGVIQGIYTASIWIKSATGSNVSMNIDVNDRFTLGFTATTEWKRISTTGFREGSFPYRFMDVNAGVNIDFYIWGPQVELGSFPTSYIPTSGAAVTRVVDDAQILGASFSNTFNTLEGTFVAECDRGNDGTEGAGIGAMRRAADSYFDMIQFGEFYDNSGMVGRVYVGGTSQAQIGATHTTGQGVYNRYSFAYKTDSFAGAINGVLQNEDTSGSLPTNLDRFKFGGYNNNVSNNNLDGHIKYLHYYPKRLTNAQLQLLTS